MNNSEQYKKALAWEQKLLEWERKLATRHVDRISEEQDWPEQERDDVKMALGLIPYNEKERSRERSRQGRG